MSTLEDRGEVDLAATRTDVEEDARGGDGIDFGVVVTLEGVTSSLRDPRKGGGSGREAKCWLLPEVEIVANRGYTRRELDRIERLVRDGAERLIRRWNEECGTASP